VKAAPAWCLLILILSAPAVFAAEPEAIPLWPGTAPGETTDLPPEADLTTAKDGTPGGRRVIRLGHVSEPTISIHIPDHARNTGTAVFVCPGGGYNILAMDWMKASGWLPPAP